MLPKEMFPEVIRKSDGCAMYVHIMALDYLVHIDEEEWEISLGGKAERIIIEGSPSEKFSFLAKE